MIHRLVHYAWTEHSHPTCFFSFFFSAQLSVKLFHCAYKHISMYSSDKLHSPEFSIPLTEVTLQGAMRLTFNGLHHLKIMDKFWPELEKKTHTGIFHQALHQQINFDMLGRLHHPKSFELILNSNENMMYLLPRLYSAFASFWTLNSSSFSFLAVPI